MKMKLTIYTKDGDKLFSTDLDISILGIIKFIMVWFTAFPETEKVELESEMFEFTFKYDEDDRELEVEGDIKMPENLAKISLRVD